MPRNEPPAFLAAADRALAERPSRTSKRRRALDLLGARLAHAHAAHTAGRPLAQVVPAAPRSKKPN